MAHPLEDKIARLRGMVRRSIALTGAGWVVAVGLAAALTLGIADYLIRFEDPGLRVLSSLALLGAVLWAGYRFLVGRLVLRLADVDLARLVQRRFPDVGSRLTSAMEFLGLPEDDPLAGSAPLRRAVVAQATAATEDVDVGELVDRRAPARALAAAAAASLALILLLALDPLSVRIASARLINPLAEIAWPRVNHLQLREVVDRVARGDALEIEIVDARGAKLPTDLRVQYRSQRDDGSVNVDSQPISALGESAIARRENVVEPFAYRVVGGDDHMMPWVEVAVVEPPALAECTAAIVPPAYTGWPAETSEPPLEVLVGTKVRFEGRSTKPLRQAVLRSESGVEYACRIDPKTPDRFTVPAESAPPIVVDETESFRLELLDAEGIRGGRSARFDIRAAPDRAPRVAMESPASTVYVTPKAVVPVRAVVKDDLAIRSVALVIGEEAPRERPTAGSAPASENRVSQPPKGPPAESPEAPAVDGAASRSERPDDAPMPQRIPLYSGPAKTSPQPRPPLGTADGGQQEAVDYRWDLAPLALEPARQVTFHVEALDYRPQRGQSQPRRLVLITEEQLAERIAGMQNQILNELSRILELQRKARQQVAALRIRAEEEGFLAQIEVDRLRGAELNQRQIGRSLDSPGEGVRMHVEGLLADLENNRFDRPDVKRRMEEVLGEIDRLAAAHLPQAQRELTAAIKSAQVVLDRRQRELPSGDEAETSAAPEKADPALLAALAAGGKHQDEVIATLQRLLEELAEWHNYQRFHRAVAQVRRRQEELASKARQIGRATLARRVEDLQPEQAADLKILAQQQGELARQVERLVQEMDATGEKLSDEDPLIAQVVLDAAARARELAVAGQMRTAADHVAKNRMGQAVTQQEQAAEQLQELLDILANRRESELTRLVKKFQQAQQELDELARDQQQVASKLNDAAAREDPGRRADAARAAAGAQQRLAESAERLARRLQRLTARQSGETVEQAAGKMHQAAGAGNGGEAAGAAKQADAAHDDLRRAEQQLEKRKRQAEIELAVQRLAQMEESILGLQKRQTSALEETVRLETLRQRNDGLGDAAIVSLRNLLETQRNLENETRRMKSAAGENTAFGLVLARAAAQMAEAAALLDRQNTSPDTQQHQQTALTRLAQLLEAIKPSEKQQGTTGSAGAGQGGQPQAGQGGPVRALAELKLLKLLQQDLNSQTRRLERKLAELEPGDAAARTRLEGEYVELSRQQGELADMILGLLPPVVADPEEAAELKLDRPQPEQPGGLEPVDPDPLETGPTDDDAPPVPPQDPSGDETSVKPPNEGPGETLADPSQPSQPQGPPR